MFILKIKTVVCYQTVKTLVMLDGVVPTTTLGTIFIIGITYLCI